MADKKVKSQNRNARYEYFLTDHLEVGLVLEAFEVKIVQSHGIDLTGSYVKIINGEMFLLNGIISGINFNKFFTSHKLENYPLIKSEYDTANRPKKLLLHKKQIKKFDKLLGPGYTLIITEVYSDVNNRIKCTLALAKGKNQRDKRNTIKERDISRKGA